MMVTISQWWLWNCSAVSLQSQTSVSSQDHRHRELQFPSCEGKLVRDSRRINPDLSRSLTLQLRRTSQVLWQVQNIFPLEKPYHVTLNLSWARSMPNCGIYRLARATEGPRNVNSGRDCVFDVGQLIFLGHMSSWHYEMYFGQVQAMRLWTLWGFQYVTYFSFLLVHVLLIMMSLTFDPAIFS